MAAAAAAARPTSPTLHEGVVSGLLGALSVAVWFFLVDSLRGHPLFTPSALGRAIALSVSGAQGGGGPVLSLGLVVLFSALHGVAFVLFGSLCAYLLNYAERERDYAIYVVMLIATLGMWFTFLSMTVAGSVVTAVTIPDVMIAHIVAAAVMGGYYLRRHPGLLARM